METNQEQTNANPSSEQVEAGLDAWFEHEDEGIIDWLGTGSSYPSITSMRSSLTPILTAVLAAGAAPRPVTDVATLSALVTDPDIGERAACIMKSVLSDLPGPTPADLAVYPSEPGLYLDRLGNVWRLHMDGVFAMSGRIREGAARYAPFQRLGVVAAAGAAPQAIRCDYCGDALPSVKSMAHIPTTPSIQRLGFDADKVVCPECVERARDALGAQGAQQEQLERAARELNRFGWTCHGGTHEPGGYDSCDDCQAVCSEVARAAFHEMSGTPHLSAEQVWAIAKAEHDYANDSDNVPAFVSSLVDALQVAGIPFDEVPFSEQGYIAPTPTPALVQVDEAKLAEALREVLAGQEAWHCTRVWEGWQHGTMSEDDFSPVAEDDEAIAEIVEAVTAALRGGAQ